MTRSMHRSLLAGAALAAVLGLAAIPAGAQETIKLGALAPLSSPGSYQQGEEMVRGMQWAVDDANAKGGVLGKKIEMITEDTQGKPPTGATSVEKLITKDKVVGSLFQHPLWLERELGLFRGNVMHLEMSLDQMFALRPFLGGHDYRAPGVRSLYLTGASTHPGGGIMGASGRNADHEVLQDWRNPLTALGRGLRRPGS